MSTFEEFKNKNTSNKVTLVRLNASKRQVGWTVESGDLYKLENFQFQVISKIEQSGVELSQVSDIGSVVAGTYFFDRQNKTLYIESIGSVNPNGEYTVVTVSLFFSNHDTILPHDLSSGYDVEWVNGLKSVSPFIAKTDRSNQIGIAIEGSGSIQVQNNDFFKKNFDKLYFEQRPVTVWQWSGELDVSEARRVFEGRISGRRYSTNLISFSFKDFFNELKAPLQLEDLSQYPSSTLNDELVNAKQRRVYGYVFGHVPSNISQRVGPISITGLSSMNQNSNVVNGSGTSYFSELKQNDEVTISDEVFSVDQIISDTQFTTQDERKNPSVAETSITVIPERPKRFFNRTHLAAGHTIKKPETTIIEKSSLSTFRVDDPSDFFVSDIVRVNGEDAEIENISYQTGLIRLTRNLFSEPTIGDVFEKRGVTNVSINDRNLQFVRDYTVDETNGTIVLEPLAEFNIAPVKKITGTVSFASGSRTVTGSGTDFENQLQAGDWIRPSNQNDFFEISSIQSETSLTLVEESTYTVGGQPIRIKKPVYFGEDTTLSCDCLGKTDDGTTSGNIISTAANIVLDLLRDSNVSEFINEPTFVSDDAPYRLGIAIPSKVNDSKSRPLRDIINSINTSVFGSLTQNSNLEFEYNLLEPNKTTSDLVLDETDVISGFSVSSQSERIIRRAVVNYRPKEYDKISSTNTFTRTTNTSDEGLYLAKTQKEKEVETLLVDSFDANIIASRWSFLLSLASTVVRFKTKLQAFDLSLADTVKFSHPLLYERVGSSDTVKFGAVQLTKKNGLDVEIEIEDLSNAFSRVAIISQAGSDDFVDATLDDKSINGYITDSFGMIDNIEETFNINLIW